MHGPGSYPPYYGYPQYPPQSGVVYVPIPTPPKGGKGRKGPKLNGQMDVMSYLVKTKEDLEKLEKLFKKEDKKDDKSKHRTFTLLETIALNFIFCLPTTLVFYGVFKIITKVTTGN